MHFEGYIAHDSQTPTSFEATVTGDITVTLIQQIACVVSVVPRRSLKLCMGPRRHVDPLISADHLN